MIHICNHIIIVINMRTIINLYSYTILCRWITSQVSGAALRTEPKYPSWTQKSSTGQSCRWCPVGQSDGFYNCLYAGRNMFDDQPPSTFVTCPSKTTSAAMWLYDNGTAVFEIWGLGGTEKTDKIRGPSEDIYANFGKLIPFNKEMMTSLTKALQQTPSNCHKVLDAFMEGDAERNSRWVTKLLENKVDEISQKLKEWKNNKMVS